MKAPKIISFILLFSYIYCIPDFTPQIPKEYEIAPWYNFTPSVITYSFDDGTFNQIQKGVPLLDKYNLKGSFNLITSWDHDWEEYKRAVEKGHEISSHTVNHPNLRDQDLETQSTELKESKKYIEKMVGKECITLVYPYCDSGDYDIAKKYYISARACSGELISSNPNDMFELSSIAVGSETEYEFAEDLNKWVDKAFEEKKWVIFLIHGIDNDGGYSPIKSSEFDKHLYYVKKNIGRFWVGTFKDVSKYILEANSLVIEENKNEEGNILIDVSCQYKTKITELDFPVTISRKIDSKCVNPKVLNENGLDEIKKTIYNGKIIFDVIPGQKYILKCDK